MSPVVIALLVACLLLVVLIVALLPTAKSDGLVSELRRIEDDIEAANRQIDRLEDEALPALREAAQRAEALR